MPLGALNGAAQHNISNGSVEGFVSLMSCIDLILGRRSIRRYKDEPVPDVVKERILEAGRQAPSAVNRQPWHFIVVEDQTLKDKLAASGRYRKFLGKCDFAVIGLYETNDPISKRWGLVDAVIALQNMVAAAAVQGVGSCWIGDYKSSEIREMFGVPEDVHVAALISFGLPDELPSQRSKKPTEEIFHHNKW